ncbi:hypothetical protein THASP1DRAFT_32855 [Thamnocephalis sphaerospora]|uniref:Uncharacterized protein n=1 Tax=Thamnocephalis sphaerospora TaxID=78915 RepID=A0A4P9XI32_9FUNG|nr:hypothetical protein THASP1DRAFT_32855 [Thamnocephalis sphaerospora]|eukprot:RKP05306.1 hypothetical protein THASP1DRAFT_32855 [Thamnocephalis sphaerospora]
MLCAFYPRFPSSVDGHRPHLQAFRHLWALAVEPRCLMVRDIETGEACTVPIELEVLSDSPHAVSGTTDGNKGDADHAATVSTGTPCVLPELSRVRAIHIRSKDHFSVTLTPSSNARHAALLSQSGTLYVKRTNGQAAKSEGLPSLLDAFTSWSLAGPQSTSRFQPRLLVEQMAQTRHTARRPNSTLLQAIARYTCDEARELTGAKTWEKVSQKTLDLRCAANLYESLSVGHTDAWPAYLALYRTARQLHQGVHVWDLHPIWDARFASIYYGSATSDEGYNSARCSLSPLLRHEFAATLAHWITDSFRQWLECERDSTLRSAFQAYATGTSSGWPEHPMLRWLLTWFRIPPSADLATVLERCPISPARYLLLAAQFPNVPLFVWRAIA